MSEEKRCKFTPLGFETLILGLDLLERPRCKFTPLGFETKELILTQKYPNCVNLPRWGLKQSVVWSAVGACVCKFTPLGFETNSLALPLRSCLKCKFTQLGRGETE